MEGSADDGVGVIGAGLEVRGCCVDAAAVDGVNEADDCEAGGGEVGCADRQGPGLVV